MLTASQGMDITLATRIYDDDNRGRRRGPFRTSTALFPLTVAAVRLHGSIVPFNHELNDCVEHLEHYFVANNIATEDKKHTILLSAVGASTYQIICTLVRRAVSQTSHLSKSCKKAHAHINPKPFLILKYYEFNTRCQGAYGPGKSRRNLTGSKH